MAQPTRPTRQNESKVTATYSHTLGAVVLHVFKASGVAPTINTAEVQKNRNAALPPTGTADFIDAEEA